MLRSALCNIGDLMHVRSVLCNISDLMHALSHRRGQFLMVTYRLATVEGMVLVLQNHNVKGAHG